MKIAAEEHVRRQAVIYALMAISRTFGGLLVQRARSDDTPNIAPESAAGVA